MQHSNYVSIMEVKINDNIKSMRELKNYTQEYMAQRLDITQAAYSKIEKGNTSISFDKLEKIATVFEVDLEAIIRFNSGLGPAGSLYKTSHSSETYSGLRLYKDKIALLEKLLHHTDLEIKRYEDKFGSL